VFSKKPWFFQSIRRFFYFATKGVTRPGGTHKYLTAKNAKEIFMKKRNLVSVLLGLALAAAMVLTGCENPSGVTPPSAVEIIVSDLVLTNYVPKPVAGEAPANAVFSGSPAQYTGIIVWEKFESGSTWTIVNDSDAFVASTVYRAVVTLTPNGGYTFNGVAANSFTYEVPDGTVTAITNNANSGEVRITFSTTAVVDATTVTDLNLTPYVTAPVRGAAPVTTLSGSPAQYTGSIVWKRIGEGDSESDVTGNFAPSTVYKAVVTLTAKYGYTFSGVEANEFTYSGATSVENEANSGEITITFPRTAAEGAANIVSDFNLAPYIPVPKTDGTPATMLSGSPGQYTGTIAWKRIGEGDSESDVTGNFVPSATYKAVVSLTAKTGFKFEGVGANSFVYSGATVTNAADSGEVTITFPATASPPLQGTVSITGTAIKVGEALTADTNIEGDGTISYVWKRGNTPNLFTDIPGAANETYTLAADDLGKYIKVTVAREGYSGSKTSIAVAIPGSIRITGINSYYNGKYAVVRSSSDTNPTGWEYLAGMDAYDAATFEVTGVQISDGSVTLPAYLVNVGNEEAMGDETVKPYTVDVSTPSMKLYVIIKDSSTFELAYLMDNHGAYTVTGVSFSSGSAEGTVTGAGTVLSITGIDDALAAQVLQGSMIGIYPHTEPVWEKEMPDSFLSLIVAGASTSGGQITVTGGSAPHTATVQFEDMKNGNADRWMGSGTYDVYLELLGSEGNPGVVYKADDVSFSPGSIRAVSAEEDFERPYMLRWGLWAGTNYGYISGNFSSQGATLTTEGAGSNAGYLTSSTAETAFGMLMSNPQFSDYGFTINSFAELVAFSNAGISAPDALQSVISGQAANLPILSVFEVNLGEGVTGVLVSYIDEFSIDEFPTEP
jgi:hypothetical protein